MVLVWLIDYLFISIFTYLSVYLSIRLSFYQSIYVYLYLSSWLFICLFLSLTTYLPTSLFGNGGFGMLRLQIFAALVIVIWYTSSVKFRGVGNSDLVGLSDFRGVGNGDLVCIGCIILRYW